MIDHKRCFVILTSVIFILTTNAAVAQFGFDPIYSDNMVLQRDSKIMFQGYGTPEDQLQLSVNDISAKILVDKTGSWVSYIDSLSSDQAYKFVLSDGKDSIAIQNVLVGDVWFCSGQSNMEWRLINTEDAQTEIAAANYNKMRLLTVPKSLDIVPHAEIKEAKWEVCTSESATDFSAVAYYFGKEILKDQDVPIGLIQSTWGGTQIETWMPMESFEKGSYEEEKISKVQGKSFPEMLKENEVARKNWLIAIDTKDNGLSDNWEKLSSYENWATMSVPGLWEDNEIGQLDGVVWYRTEINLTKEEAEKGALLSLGRIDDTDYLYVNGALIDSTILQHDKYRKYTIEGANLKEGANNIVVRIKDVGGDGGFWGLTDSVFYSVDDKKHRFSPKWQYKIGTVSLEKRPSWLGPNSYPSLLFNTMVNPVTSFPIKGFLWYQGENNTSYPDNYAPKFKKLIKSWRKYWTNEELPFLFVQLPNYEPGYTGSQANNWPKLRDAQTAALSLEGTGMAVTIDLGSPNNIHPRRKKEVSERLASIALANVYNKNIQDEGPRVNDFQFIKDKVIITFKNLGPEVEIGQVLNNFEIAGNDQNFVQAKAVIKSNTEVEISSDEVKKPVAVRFAWENNPENFNFYNSNGLPAVPFRTDEW